MAESVQLKVMKVLIGSLVVVSLFGLATIGMLGMEHSSGTEDHGGCLAATAQGTTCPEGANPFESLDFHLGAFRLITLASLTNSGFSQISLLALLLVLTWLVNLYCRSPGLTLDLPLRPAYQLARSSIPLRQPLTDWLALHETSPTVF